jgi:dTDP-4-dehydrorhamnose reductase
MGGIWHWCGDERLTRYAMATVMARLLGISIEHLRPDASPGNGAARPHDCRLDCSRLERRGLGRRTPFAQALARVLEESSL